MKIEILFYMLFFTGISLAVEPVSAQNKSKGVTAVSATEFLNSLGVVSSISRRGETLSGTIDCVKYTGLRWLRAGYEDDATIEDFVQLHKKTGVLLSYGLLSGHSDIPRLISGAQQLASAGALIALESANEPNNWEITYQGQTGGRGKSWLPVAKMQRDLYKAVKSDPVLKNYPVWSISENGAQTDNAGLQFLTIPKGAKILMPTGTRYADYANCHNYVCHPNWPGLHDNQTWISASPTKICPVDGLSGNYGITWAKHFPGYTEKELLTLPRVTTETGYSTDTVGCTEEVQACLYLNLYLSQFKQGWKYTAIYLLKGRANEPEHEAFAFYRLDYKPKMAAHYLHNFTTILADNQSVRLPDRLNYNIPNQPTTTHDLLLQKGNGKFVLVLWGERFAGGMDKVTVMLGKKHETVKIYDPTTGFIPVKTLREINEVTVALTNHPVIIEIEK